MGYFHVHVRVVRGIRRGHEVRCRCKLDTSSGRSGLPHRSCGHRRLRGTTYSISHVRGHRLLVGEGHRLILEVRRDDSTNLLSSMGSHVLCLPLRPDGLWHKCGMLLPTLRDCVPSFAASCEDRFVGSMFRQRVHSDYRHHNWSLGVCCVHSWIGAILDDVSRLVAPVAQSCVKTAKVCPFGTQSVF